MGEPSFLALLLADQPKKSLLGKVRHVTEPPRNSGTLAGTQYAAPVLLMLEAAGGYTTVSTRWLKRSRKLQHTVANSSMVCALELQTGSGPSPDREHSVVGKNGVPGVK